ncbi:hypothetical protein B0J18DRAFT_423794 [Chaetomium sp. MPI-SDFR-AT-0129]|nr:hypothetical protein B0J18DRAFT_423794 [Chaetomium sp. MPI-SDFR-AT-0129]
MGDNTAQSHTRDVTSEQQHAVPVDPEASAAATTDNHNHPDAPIQDAPSTNSTAAAPVVVEDLEPDSSPPTPRFLQDEGSWKRFKWVPYPVRRLIKAGATWAQGPQPPRRYHIDPLFPLVQHAPIVLVDKFLPRKRHRGPAVFVFWAVWLVAFALVMRAGLTAAEIPTWGTPTQIGCGSTYWASGNGCGLDGVDCRPFADGGFAFRCPANCASYQVLNPRAVGDQEILYQQLVIGGPPEEEGGPSHGVINDTAVYRGDSFICGSAIHAGVISNANGGCGVVKLIGRAVNFNSTTRNGITSIGFDSYFPLSFSFEPDVQCDARDVVWSLLAISVVFTAVFSLFVTSPALFYFPVFTVLFWTVGMATDAPTHSDIPSLISTEIAQFLPAMFVGWVMYDKMGVRRTLKGLTAQVEKTVLWLGAAWVGALTNYTLDFIPINRLTPHDLNQQPGARAALAIIILILLAISVSQIYFFRQEARLLRNLALYALLILAIVIGVALPNFSLRIHHFVLALLLLPGTAIQTRPSLLYQGLLIGLFINGIARWGFGSVLQTAYELRGDAPLDSPLPVIRTPEIILGGNASSNANSSSITFTWDPAPSAYDGISVLVNDVERFRQYFYDSQEDNAGAVVNNVTWVRDDRHHDDDGEAGAAGGVPEYFRFAWMQGSQRGDYTRAGVWGKDGQWEQMVAGPSRVRRRRRGWEEEDLVVR